MKSSKKATKRVVKSYKKKATEPASKKKRPSYKALYEKAEREKEAYASALKTSEVNYKKVFEANRSLNLQVEELSKHEDYYKDLSHKYNNMRTFYDQRMDQIATLAKKLSQAKTIAWTGLGTTTILCIYLILGL